MPDGTLLIAGRRYVETDEHLLRELYGERRVAFQQDESGNITGMVRDGSSVAQSFKVPAYATIGVAGPLLGFCFLVFLGVLLRRFYQHTLIKQWVPEERRAFGAAVAVAVANFGFLIAFSLSVLPNPDALRYDIPFLLKLGLCFPLLAVIATLYLLAQTVVVWRGGLCVSAWARIRFTVVTACALFTAWFYYYWNLLGFNYY